MILERLSRTLSARLFALIVSACLGSGCASPSLSTADLQADEAASSYTRILRAAAAVRQSGDVAAASMLYERAHELNPEDAAPLLALGEMAASEGTAGQAARILREALRRAPDDINARRLYGNALLVVDAPAQAAEQFRRVLGVEPHDTRTLNALGVSLDLQGEHEEAQRIYRSALELRPDHLPLRNNLALSIALTGDTGQALTMLQDLANRLQESGAPRDSLHHVQVHDNILMVLALGDDVAGTALRQRLEVSAATPKPPAVRSPDSLLAMARLPALVSRLAPAAGVTAATLVATNGLDWPSIEGIVRSAAGPTNINWLDPYIPPTGGRHESSSVRPGNSGIASLIAQQRQPFPAGVNTRDAANNDQVIAADVCRHDAAFEADKTSLQQLAAVFACPVREFGELTFASGRKYLRHVVLTFGEDINRDGSVTRIGIQTGRVQPEAEKDERGVERQRAERADRDADGTAIRAEGGDDRHSGGKATEGVPETICIDHSSSFCDRRSVQAHSVAGL